VVSDFGGSDPAPFGDLSLAFSCDAPGAVLLQENSKLINRTIDKFNSLISDVNVEDFIARQFLKFPIHE
jgi:hypothetical protein